MAGATKYTLTARRGGTSQSVDITSHTDGQRHSIDLSGQADDGRGAWTLEVTASNQYTTSGTITHIPSTSTSAPSAAVAVGKPAPPTGISVVPGSNSVVLTFRQAAGRAWLGRRPSCAPGGAAAARPRRAAPPLAARCV